MKTTLLEAHTRAESEPETVDVSGWIESATPYAVLFRPGRRNRFGVEIKHVWIPHEELDGQKPAVWFRTLHFATLADMMLDPYQPLSHPARLTIRKDRWLDAAPKSKASR